MKKMIFRTATTLLMVFFLTISLASFSQMPGDPTPPPPPGEHGLSGNQPVGGGAPVGSGLAILLALGAAYGGKRVFDLRKNTD